MSMEMIKPTQQCQKLISTLLATFPSTCASFLFTLAEQPSPKALSASKTFLCVRISSVKNKNVLLSEEREM
jgi:hypothetical protein